jgi:hypothetical protein
MKTCKVGCGKMKSGGTIKKVKKMAKGGAAGANFGYPLNGLPMRPTNGNTDISKNQMGTNPTMKKGGVIRKLVKAQKGTPVKKFAPPTYPKNRPYTEAQARLTKIKESLYDPMSDGRGPRTTTPMEDRSNSVQKKGGSIKMKKYADGGVGGKKNKKNPPEENTPITKPEVATSKKTYKNPLMARAASYFTGKTEYQKKDNPVSGMSVTRTYKDGKKERVLKSKMKTGGSLKPVTADKVGLSKLPTTVRNKMGYQKKGGSIKKK